MPAFYPVDLFSGYREPLTTNNGHRRVPAYQVPAAEVPLVCSWEDWERINERDRECLRSRYSFNTSRDIPLSSLCPSRNRDNSYRGGFCREKRAGRWLERRVCSNVQGSSNIRVLPWEVDTETGEVLRPYVCIRDCEYDGEALYYDPEDVRYMRRSASRVNDIRSVRRSCERFKWIVRANERKVRLFLTLTYAENMTDTKQLYEDFRRFWQKVCREFPGVSGYLAACEPQKRGAWHMHILVLSNRPRLYMSNKVVNSLWGHGFTKVQKVSSVNDVGSYLTSYLTNVKKGLSTKKGARLSLYPVGFRFARWSRSVRRASESSWHGVLLSRLRGGDHYTVLYDYQNERRVSSDFKIFSRVVLLCKEKPK